jgi:hypothetical protein
MYAGFVRIHMLHVKGQHGGPERIRIVRSSQNRSPVTESAVSGTS